MTNLIHADAKIKSPWEMEQYVSDRPDPEDMPQQFYVNVVAAFRPLYNQLFDCASDPTRIQIYDDHYMIGAGMRDHTKGWLAETMCRFERDNLLLAFEAALYDFRFIRASSPAGARGHTERVSAAADRLLHMVQMHTAWDLLPKMHETANTSGKLREMALAQGDVPLQMSGEALDYLSVAARKNPDTMNKDHAWQGEAHRLTAHFKSFNDGYFPKNVRSVAGYYGGFGP